MSRSKFFILATLLILVAAAVRINNALVFLPLRGYDGFGHFTYIWFMSKTWYVPLPTSGWSFFHPPLYYWGMAALWNGLPSVDPILRLKIGTLIVSLLSLTHALVIYLIVRRVAPGQRLIQLMAMGLMLFLPVHIYSTSFLGNEQLGAVLCSLSLLALLWVLAKPSAWRSLVLGICLGLAMLAKFTGIVVVAAAGVILALQLVRRGDWRAGCARLAIVGACVLAISGWYYGRNLMVYGNPFKMSRDEFMVQHVERLQTRGNRGLLEYVLFDPLILFRPQFPRGLPLTGPLPPNTERSSLRESVWTGMYANTWFDGFGGWVLPPVFGNEFSRRAGQILLTLATVPTAVILLGIVVGVRRLWRDGWDDTLVVMAVTFVMMLVVFVHGTRVAPMHGAVKATYFMPITVVFSYWFTLGLLWVAERSRRMLRLIVAESGVLTLVILGVFTQGVLTDPDFGEQGPWAEAIWSNLRGVVYYAGGDRDTAKRYFETSAGLRQYLAFENLATLALEDGRSLEALHLLRTAAALEPSQSFGAPADRKTFDRITQADYQNSMATMYADLRWKDDALRAAEAALQLDPSIPEAGYNVGVLKLLRAASDLSADGAPQSERARALVEQARGYFFRSVMADPGFLDGLGMLGVTQAMLGDCNAARGTLKRALQRDVRQEYPVETGRGIVHSAAIRRRRRIADLPEILQPQVQYERCATPSRP